VCRRGDKRKGIGLRKWLVLLSAYEVRSRLTPKKRAVTRVWGAGSRPGVAGKKGKNLFRRNEHEEGISDEGRGAKQTPTTRHDVHEEGIEGPPEGFREERGPRTC